jgi:hypothetical protein
MKGFLSNDFRRFALFQNRTRGAKMGFFLADPSDILGPRCPVAEF